MTYCPMTPIDDKSVQRGQVIGNVVIGVMAVLLVVCFVLWVV